MIWIAYCMVFISVFIRCKGSKTCAATEYNDGLIAKDPDAKDIEDEFNQFFASRPSVIEKPWKDNLEIPLTVHIVYNTAAQNINYEQIISQMIVLNADYNQQNNDWTQTPSEFIQFVTDYHIEFKLNKIIRQPTTTTTFDYPTDDIHYTNDGGSDAVDDDISLNIWVGPLGGAGGWCALPPNAQLGQNGPVNDVERFGSRDYDYAGEFNLCCSGTLDIGRTATHEIGHWLFLYHIWGELVPEDSDCNDSDWVEDTPNQESANRDCPTGDVPSCDTNDMYMNYMDYVDDHCQYMFTNIQAERTYATMTYPAFASTRGSFLEYQNHCTPKFISALYFIVNLKSNSEALSCGYSDIPSFGVIDLNRGYSSEYEVIPCIQTTKNKNIDPIIDIEVVDDGACSANSNYFINTNLHYARSGFEGIETNVCYQKGDTTVLHKDRIVNIGFFESAVEVTESTVYVPNDYKCNRWHLVLFDINRGIYGNSYKYKYLYLGYQYGDDFAYSYRCYPTSDIRQITEKKW